MQPLQTEWQQLVVLFIQLVEGLILAKLLIPKVRIILLSQMELLISQLKHGARVAVGAVAEQLVSVALVAVARKATQPQALMKPYRKGER